MCEVFLQTPPQVVNHISMVYRPAIVLWAAFRYTGYVCGLGRGSVNNQCQSHSGSSSAPCSTGGQLQKNAIYSWKKECYTYANEDSVFLTEPILFQLIIEERRHGKNF